MKNSISRFRQTWFFRLVLVWAIGVTPAFANPTGGSVAAGSATITNGTNTTTINQASQTAIINWNSFSIGAGQTTSFLAQQANSAVLNRVTGGQRSIINGNLNGNESVFLINGNGVLVGSSGAVNINGGSFVASTRDMADSDFLAGNYHFTGSNAKGVHNLGQVSALGGDVVLIGKTASNAGTIAAPDGHAALAAGDDVLLAQTGSQHVFVNPSANATSAAGRTAVNNTGTISGAAAELRAANGNLYALAINNAGTIRATTVSRQGGDIYLTADSGLLQNTGTLDASATVAGANGGTITMKDMGGTTDNSQGHVIALAGAGGTGGSAEISGGVILGIGDVQLGKGGQLLLDPTNVTIENVADNNDTNSGGTYAPGTGGTANNPDDSIVNAAELVALLDAGTSVTITTAETGTAGTDAGDITVAAPLTWNTGNGVLTLSAYNNIYLNADITSAHGGLTLDADNTYQVLDNLVSVSFGVDGATLLPGSSTTTYMSTTRGQITSGSEGAESTTGVTANVNVGSFVMVNGFWVQNMNEAGPTYANTLPTFSATKDFEISGVFERYLGGAGTAASPYQIADVYGLQGIGAKEIETPSFVSAGIQSFAAANGLSATTDFVAYPLLASSFDLANNIDASVTANWRNGNGFVPIGFAFTPNGQTGFFGDGNAVNLRLGGSAGKYDGTFDGKGFAIDQLTENYGVNPLPIAANVNPGFGDVGLFDAINKASAALPGIIQNLGLTNISFSTAGATSGPEANQPMNLGGLVADAPTGTVSNDYVTGTITATAEKYSGTLYTSFAGGLIGEVTGLVTITDDSAAVDLNLSGFGWTAGGLIGALSSSITDSFASGNITINNNGGLPAQADSGTNNGNGIGGLVGLFGGTHAGGSNSAISIKNSYATGNIIDPLADVHENIGGLVGRANNGVNGNLIVNSYSTGVVTATPSTIEQVGIFAGTLTTPNAKPALSGNSYYDNDGQSDSINPIGSEANNTSTDAALLIGLFGPSDTNGNAITAPYTLGQTGVPIIGGTGTAFNGFSGTDWQAAATVSGTTHGFPTLVLAAHPPTPDATSITLTGPTGNTSVYGQTINFLATIIDAITGTNTPTGSILFQEMEDGSWVTIGTGTLTGTNGTDTATFSLAVPNQLSVGGYSLQALYNGVGLFLTSNSSALALTITPAPVTVTPNSGQSVVYGTGFGGGSLPNFTYTTSGLVGTDSLAGSLNGYGLDGNGKAPNVGSYNITQGTVTTANNPNYTVTFDSTPVTYAVTPAPVNVTVTSGQTAQQNTTPTFTFTTGALANGDTALGGALTGDTTGAISSTSPITPGTLASANPNYAITFVGGTGNTSTGQTFTIVSLPTDTVTLTLGDGFGVSGTTTYGTQITLTGTLADTTHTGTTVTDGSVTFSANGSTVGSAVTVTGNTVTMSLGLLDAASLAYQLGATYSGGTNGSVNFSSAVASAISLLINKAALVIEAGNISKVYGQTATLGASTSGFSVVSGLVSGTGDAVTSVDLASAGAAGTAGVNSGTPYAIVASNAAGTGLSNYDITYQNGALTVTPAPLTVTASNASKVYGQTPTLTGFTTGTLFNGDTVTGVTLNSAGLAGTAGVAGGPYAITASNATGTGLDNYTLTYANGSLTVTPATLTLTALDQTILSGGSISQLGYSVAGLQNGEFLSQVLTGKPTLTASGGAISLAATANANYTVDAVSGAVSTATGTPDATTVQLANAFGTPANGTTLTATVSDNTTSSTTVGSGQVVFAENGYVLQGGTQAVSNGTASVVVSSVPSGSFDLTALFLCDNGSVFGTSEVSNAITIPPQAGGSSSTQQLSSPLVTAQINQVNASTANLVQTVNQGNLFSSQNDFIRPADLEAVTTSTVQGGTTEGADNTGNGGARPAITTIVSGGTPLHYANPQNGGNARDNSTQTPDGTTVLAYASSFTVGATK